MPLATMTCALKTSPGGVSVFQMDKDASYLRCSKLTCYAEFNRMVNAIAKHGTTAAGVVNGKDYCFSAALAGMLRQVTSNPDEQDQKRELEKVHDWYLANKPLLFSPKTRKPIHMTPTTDHRDTLSRPRTAPALLNDSTSEDRQGDKELRGKVRPHTTFAANYMTTILGINSEAVIPAYRIRSQGSERRCNSAKTPTRVTHTKIRNSRRKPALMSKVLIPGRGESVSETYRCSNKETSLSEVYDFASEVADQMIAEKHELEQCRQTMRDLLVPDAADKPPDKGKPNVIQAKDEQFNAENITAEGSSIKVSISQDSLLTKSPQHKQSRQTSDKKPNTAPASRNHTTQGLSSITEKNTTSEKNKSRKSSQLERLHSHVKLQLYEFPDNGKTSSNDEFVKHPKPLMPYVAGFNTKRYVINSS